MSAKSDVTVRTAGPDDVPALIKLRAALWPDAPLDEHRTDVLGIVQGEPRSTLPLTCFVAERDGRLLGFVEVGLRSHADGCDPTSPCGFIEGWYVVPEETGGGLGRALVQRAELWAREQGCRELASDTWADNEKSIAAHRALGFDEVDRCVSFHKSIAEAPDATSTGEGTLYGADLARIHRDHFGSLAVAAATVLVTRLRARGVHSGTVVELGCGSGNSCKVLSDAGYDVIGVDSSEQMLALARQDVPGARFERGSLWQFALPRAVAVTAVGEVFGYASELDIPNGHALAARLAQVFDSLADGGILLFDVAGPGRSSPARRRQASWEKAGSFVWLDESENDNSSTLTRVVDTFVPVGRFHRHSRERHRLALFEPVAVEDMLERSGFEVERLSSYGSFHFLPGWAGFLAEKRVSE